MQSVYVLAVICLFIQAFYVGETNALRCYTCNNCEKETAAVDECASDENVCLKLDAGSMIAKRCSKTAMCNLKSIEEGWNKFWTSVTNPFTDDKRDHSDRKKVVSCCDTSYCNAGHSIKFSHSLSVIIGLGVFFCLFG